MSSIVTTGMIQRGQVVVTEPIDLPDGSEVTILGCPRGECVAPNENDKPLTPEEIATALSAMGRLEPFSWTAAEREAWEAQKRASREGEKSKFLEEAERLRRIWE